MMFIYKTTDNDAQEAVIIEYTVDGAIQTHCAEFGTNQDNVSIKLVGEALKDQKIGILLSK